MHFYLYFGSVGTGQGSFLCIDSINKQNILAIRQSNVVLTSPNFKLNKLHYIDIDPSEFLGIYLPTIAQRKLFFVESYAIRLRYAMRSR